jgi:hypothetical protein
MRCGHVFFLLLIPCVGCTAVIVPPDTAGKDVVSVVVADYGYHSTIIFPKSDGGLIEYAFGDWTYFCNNDKSLGTALHALIKSDQATLGRRLLERDPRQPGLVDAIGAKGLVRFSAPRDKVREMEWALDRRFSTHLDSLVYSPAQHLYFVKDDGQYDVAHNCNHFTARLIEGLGCQIQGMVLTSDFKLGDQGQPPVQTAGVGEASAVKLAAH